MYKSVVGSVKVESFISSMLAHLSILFNAGQGTETWMLDIMFPLDHPNFDLGAESSRFTML